MMMTLNLPNLLDHRDLYLAWVRQGTTAVLRGSLVARVQTLRVVVLPSSGDDKVTWQISSDQEIRVRLRLYFLWPHGLSIRGKLLHLTWEET